MDMRYADCRRPERRGAGRRLRVLLVLLALSVAAFHSPRAQEQSTAELLARLEVPTSGTYHSLGRSRFFGLDPEARRAVAEHARSMLRECRGRIVTDLHVPASAQPMDMLGEHFATLSWTRFEPDGWIVQSTPQTANPATTTRLTARTESELFHELRQEDWRSPTSRRLRDASPIEDADGSLRTFLRFRSQVLAVLGAPEARLETSGSSGGAELTWYLELGEGWDWHALEPALPGNGVIEQATRAVVAWRPEERVLRLSWHDCGDGTLVESSMGWSGPPGEFPATIRQTEYFSGGRLLKSTQTVVTRRASADDELPEPLGRPWDPGSALHDTVDRRFGTDGPPVERASPDALPTTAAELINSLSQRSGQRSDPTGRVDTLEWPAFLELLEHQDPSTARRRGALRVRPHRFDLGRAPLGSHRPFVFELINRSEQTIDLGGPQADCGCLDLQLSQSRLPPGGASLLRGTQQVQAMGSKEHRVRLSVVQGGVAADDLELVVTYEGTAAFAAPFTVVDLGVLDGEQVKLPVAFRMLEFGCTDADVQARAEISGDLAGLIESARAPSGGAYELRFDGMARITRPELFGILRADALVRSSLCDSPETTRSLELVANRAVPVVEEWPECVVIVRSDRPGSVTFRGIEVLSAELGAGLAGQGFRCEVSSPPGDERASRVTVRVEPELRPGPGVTSGECVLESTHGMIRVLVYYQP